MKPFSKTIILIGFDIAAIINSVQALPSNLVIFGDSLTGVLVCPSGNA